MDVQTIIFIAMAFCFGSILAWGLARRGSKSDTQEESTSENQAAISNLQTQVDKLQQENETLCSRLSDAEKSAQNMLREKEQALKSEYESLLQRIKDENTRLDAALKLATEGKVDESVQQQLQEAEKSAETVRDLEARLGEIRSKYEALIAESEPLNAKLDATKAECDKLIKKVKNLEDDLEDAEDEQASLEKKLKTKIQELQEASEELDKSARDNKHLKSELEQKDYELAGCLDELKRKRESISFVQSIISADEFKSDKNIKTLYRSIDFFESFLKGQFMDCNAYLYNTYPSLSFDGASGRAGFVEKKKIFLQLFEEWASVKRKSWLDKKTTIAFVGEFSAGKTSIVNRILSQDNPNIPRLPVSTKATTAIPTYIASGEGKDIYRFVTPDDKLKRIDEGVFKKVSKELLDEIKGVSSLIKYFVMSYKNPNLNGLSILDTPGFNSNDAEDKERTIDIINECDALFWVFDVNAGTVNRSSISLIKERLNKPLIVVINKVDTKPATEVDKVEALIRKTLSESGLTVEKFIRFSAKAPLNDIMAPIHSIRRDSSRDEFVDNVGADIKHLLDIISGEVKDAEKGYQECSSKTRIITDNFLQKMSQLIQSAEKARNIPNFVQGTKVFGLELTEDKYEMSTGQANKMKSLLDTISGSLCQELRKLYDRHTDSVADEQKKYSDLIDLKVSWQKVDDCLKEYNKAAKELSNNLNN